jgi:hypothetical protein
MTPTRLRLALSDNLTWLKFQVQVDPKAAFACVNSHIEVTILLMPGAQLVISSLLQWAPAGLSGQSQLP